MYLPGANTRRPIICKILKIRRYETYKLNSLISPFVLNPLRIYIIQFIMPVRAMIKNLPKIYQRTSGNTRNYIR